MRYIESASIVAVSDPIESARKQAQDVFGATAAYDNVDAMLDKETLDAVIVVSPIYLHEQHVSRAAAHGLHVLCAKPMARTVDEAERMIAVCQANQVLLGVALQRRWLPAMWTATEMIRAGMLGRVFHLDCLWTSWSMVPGGTWRDTRECLGGIFQDHGSHTIDLAQQWLGPVEQISSIALNVGAQYGAIREVEDHMTALFYHQDGVSSYHEHTRNCHRPVSELYRIHGTEATLEIEYTGDWAYLANDCWEMRLYRGGAKIPQRLQPRRPDYRLMDQLPDSHFAYYRELSGFFDAVRLGESRQIPTGNDGLALVSIIGAAFLSAIERRTTTPVEGRVFDRDLFTRLPRLR
jgi:predicted dehydrogenase